MEADSNGSSLIIDVSIIGLPRLTLVNICAPNKDSPQFFTDLWDSIVKMGNADTIVCGDWNSVRDYSKDTHNYARQNNPKAKEVIDNGILSMGLNDVWRLTNPHVLQVHMVDK